MTEFQKPNNKVPYPFKRYFARVIDIFLYSLIVQVVMLKVFHVNILNGRFPTWLYIILSMVTMLFVEPLLLSQLGATLGKWIFGLVVREHHDVKLSYMEGLTRTFNVLHKGYGFNIPFYNLYRLYVSFKACRNNEVLPWDHDNTYLVKEKALLRWGGFIVSVVVFYFAFSFVNQLGSLPIHRGEVAVEEYVENYNYFNDYLGLGIESELMTDGTWHIREGSFFSFDDRASFITQTFDVTDNKLKKITLDYQSNNEDIYGVDVQVILAYLAFVGTDKSIDYDMLYDEKHLDQIRMFSKNFEFYIGDIKVTNKVEKEGYKLFSDYLTSRNSNEDPSFHMIYTIEYVE